MDRPPPFFPNIIHNHCHPLLFSYLFVLQEKGSTLKTNQVMPKRTPSSIVLQFTSSLNLEALSTVSV